MKNVVVITPHARRMEQEVRLASRNCDSQQGRAGQHKQDSGRRGVVLEFPSASPWPLYVAAIALMAVGTCLAPVLQA